MKRFTTLLLAAFVLSIAAPAYAAGPFKDVPKGHWAYKAVEQAVEAGILQGYDGKFHGGKTLTRYQMAIVVSRMLNRIETSPSGKYGKKDIENLEALVIEFADELALLNVKVSTLEDAFQAMKKDVDAMKAAHEKKDGHAGISGMLQTRLVVTDEDATAAIRGTVGAAAAATGSISRYPAAINGAGTRGVSRTFFNVAQASIGFDRHFDEDFYLHLQADVDADNETAYKAIQINEAYVDLEKTVADGDIRARVGVWALPFSRERNPEMVEYPNQLRHGFRTLDLTISPTLSDQTWEGIRNTGLALWNGKDSAFQWQIGVGNNNNNLRDGSLMASKLAYGFAFGDILQPVDNVGAGTENLGAYGWVGDKYAGGFRWDAGVYANGGKLNPAADEIGTASEFVGYQVNAGWWGWENWGFMGSYYGSSSSSFSPTPIAAATTLGGATAFTTLGLYLGVPAGGAVFPDVDSQSMSILMNYKFSDDNNVTARYEAAEDKLGAAKITGRLLTLGWNHRVSTNSLLQLEYLAPKTETVTRNANATTTKNSTDIADDLIQMNYKVRF